MSPAYLDALLAQLDDAVTTRQHAAIYLIIVDTLGDHADAPTIALAEAYGALADVEHALLDGREPHIERTLDTVERTWLPQIPEGGQRQRLLAHVQIHRLVIGYSKTTAPGGDA